VRGFRIRGKDGKESVSTYEWHGTWLLFMQEVALLARSCPHLPVNVQPHRPCRLHQVDQVVDEGGAGGH
jgi:hypothetical protein